ncbi:MAG: carboxypeptidase regulatory-like domain-containing protein [Terracidiphilus sp.]
MAVLLAFLAPSCVVGAPVLLAQVTGATLSGTVTDLDKKVIPNAAITLTNVAQGTMRTTNTNGSGNYTLPNVMPGDYNLEIVVQGLQHKVQSDLALTVRQNQTNNVVLPMGMLGQVVRVAGSTTLVDLGSSAMSVVVEGETARELPLNGRDWTQLAALEPGTVTVRSQPDADNASSRGNRGFGQQLSIAGGRPQLNSYRIDGIVVNDYANSTPGGTVGLTLGADAIGGFSVISSNYSASYGMTGGGVIDAVTRQGTNQYNGSVYEFVRNDFSDAMGYFDPSKLPFRRHQFGFSLGGPIRRSKLFFFGNYEGLRNVLTTAALPTVPTQSAKNGTVGGVMYTLDPNVVPYFGFWALPNYAIKTDTGTYRFRSKQVAPENFFTIRVDYAISPSDSMYSTYQYDYSSTLQPDVLNVNDQESIANRQLLSISWNHIFTSSLYNAVRVGADRESAGSLIALPGANPIGADAALGAVPGLDAPLIAVGGGITGTAGGVHGGTAAYYGWTTPQFADDGFWNKGKQSIRFGALADRIESNIDISSYNFGKFTFTSWPSFLTNQPTTLSIATTPPTPIDLRQAVFGAYVEDGWKVKPNLTLTYGVRYEMATVPAETKNRLANVRDLTSPTLYLGSPLFQNPTKKNFEPRLGFSYSPAFSGGNAIVSGGYGLYDILPLTYLFNLQLSQVGPYSINLSNADPLPQGSFPKTAAQMLLRGSGGGLPAESFVQYKTPRDYTSEYNLTVQLQLAGKIGMKVGYVGSHAVHQNLYTSDANTPTPLVNTRTQLIFPCAKEGTMNPTGQYVTCKSAGPKRNPSFGALLSSGWYAGSNYNGLLFELKERLKSLQWRASFTWQKSLDTGSSVTSGTPFQNSLNQYLFHPVKGPSDYNLPEVFVTDAIWHAPNLAKPDGVLHFLLNRWQITGVYQASGGAPFSMVMAGDTLGLGSGSPLNFPDRIFTGNCAGNPVNPGNRLTYVKLSCFYVATNPTGQTSLGNAGRNQLRGPAYQDIDLSLVKNIYVPRWGEGRRLELRADVFNIANHPNLDPPYTNDSFTVATDGTLVTDPAQTSAGQITETAQPRQIQISAKLVF